MPETAALPAAPGRTTINGYNASQATIGYPQSPSGRRSVPMPIAPPEDSSSYQSPGEYAASRRNNAAAAAQSQQTSIFAAAASHIYDNLTPEQKQQFMPASAGAASLRITSGGGALPTARPQSELDARDKVMAGRQSAYDTDLAVTGVQTPEAKAILAQKYGINSPPPLAPRDYREPMPLHTSEDNTPNPEGAMRGEFNRQFQNAVKIGKGDEFAAKYMPVSTPSAPTSGLAAATDAGLTYAQAGGGGGGGGGPKPVTDGGIQGRIDSASKPASSAPMPVDPMSDPDPRVRAAAVRNQGATATAKDTNATRLTIAQLANMVKIDLGTASQKTKDALAHIAGMNADTNAKKANTGAATTQAAGARADAAAAAKAPLTASQTTLNNAKAFAAGSAAKDPGFVAADKEYQKNVKIRDGLQGQARSYFEQQRMAVRPDPNDPATWGIYSPRAKPAAQGGGAPATQPAGGAATKQGVSVGQTFAGATVTQTGTHPDGRRVYKLSDGRVIDEAGKAVQ